MKISTPLVASHLINVAILVAIGAWYGESGGWQPIVAFLSFLLPYYLTGKQLLKGVHSVDTNLISDEEFRVLILDVHQKVINLSSNRISTEDLITDKPHTHQTAIMSIIYFLQGIGLLNIGDKNLIDSVSERALAFVSSLLLSFINSTEIIGDWKAKGSSNLEAKKIRKMLTDMEKYRISKQGALAPPSRKIQSSLVLVKGKFQGEDRFLMQWSFAWSDGYYWFIGGIKDASDTTLDECAIRELGEEMGLQPSSIESLNLLGVVNDKRISSRIGAYTDYEYSIFYVLLDSLDEQVKRLHNLEFVLTSYENYDLGLKRRNRWFKWEEIREDKDLQRDAGVIIQFINNYPPEAIPLSSSIEIQA